MAFFAFPSLSGREMASVLLGMSVLAVASTPFAFLLHGRKLAHTQLVDK